MGGSPTKVDRGQAAASNASATAASNQSTALSKQYGQQEQQQYGNLFGANGKGGSLGGMLDPKSLTSPGLNPAYQTQWNQAQDQIGKSYADQRGSLARSWADRGMGASNTPSGFQADQMRKLGSSEADTRGATFTGLTGAQHEEALKNFWNANNIASGQAASAGTGALTGANNAGQIQANLYGTSGKQAQTGTSAATGITESMCAADGSKILMSDGTRKMVEDLKKGDLLMGLDGKPDELISDPEPTLQKCCEVFVREGRVKVSWTHTFVREHGGYSFAAKSLGEVVQTDHGPRPILEVRELTTPLLCRHLMLKRSHGYCVEIFWSLE